MRLKYAYPTPWALQLRERGGRVIKLLYGTELLSSSEVPYVLKIFRHSSAPEKYRDFS